MWEELRIADAFDRAQSRLVSFILKWRTCAAKCHAGRQDGRQTPIVIGKLRPSRKGTNASSQFGFRVDDIKILHRTRALVSYS
jgi:hypothetical protein